MAYLPLEKIKKYSALAILPQFPPGFKLLSIIFDNDAFVPLFCIVLLVWIFYLSSILLNYRKGCETVRYLNAQGCRVS